MIALFESPCSTAESECDQQCRHCRNFEVERLELQSQCMNLESRVTDGEAGAEAEQAKSGEQAA